MSSSSSNSTLQRAPQVGDTVTITYKDKNFTRSIVSIEGNIIFLNDSGIIWKNNRWEFLNGELVQNIRFARSRQERLESSVFTGSHLTDMHVLAEADDQTFHNLCRTNLRLRDICMNSRLESQLYEMRVKIHFADYYPMFGEDWGKYYEKGQLIKPTWKEIYQKLSKMEREDLLYLLTADEPIMYPEDYEFTGEDDDPWEMYLPIIIMGKYPDIFKFVYIVRPSVLSHVQSYIDGNNRLSQKNWKGIAEVLKWLLELDELELTVLLLRDAALIGYGPFIRYLVQEKGAVLDLNLGLIAIAHGAGDIWDLLSDIPEMGNRTLTQQWGMEFALQMGNIEGLEGFHNRGFRLDGNPIERVDLYPEETIAWLSSHGYSTTRAD